MSSAQIAAAAAAATPPTFFGGKSVEDACELACTQRRDAYEHAADVHNLVAWLRNDVFSMCDMDAPNDGAITLYEAAMYKCGLGTHAAALLQRVLSEVAGEIERDWNLPQEVANGGTMLHALAALGDPALHLVQFAVANRGKDASVYAKDAARRTAMGVALSRVGAGRVACLLVEAMADCKADGGVRWRRGMLREMRRVNNTAALPAALAAFDRVGADNKVVGRFLVSPPGSSAQQTLLDWILEADCAAALDAALKEFLLLSRCQELADWLLSPLEGRRVLILKTAVLNAPGCLVSVLRGVDLGSIAAVRDYMPQALFSAVVSGRTEWLTAATAAVGELLPLVTVPVKSRNEATSWCYNRSVALHLSLLCLAAAAARVDVVRLLLDARCEWDLTQRNKDTGMRAVDFVPRDHADAAALVSYLNPAVSQIVNNAIKELMKRNSSSSSSSSSSANEPPKKRKKKVLVEKKKKARSDSFK